MMKREYTAAINVAIATDLMGWVVKRCGSRCDCINYTPPGAMSPQVVPAYSTDLAQAWLVVKEMKRRGYWLKLETDWYGRDRVVAWFIPHNKEYQKQASVVGDTEPMVICQAALTAVISQRRSVKNV